MMREIFFEDMSLWICVWQSTLFAILGLAGSFLLRHRPARASQMLFLSMIAAVFLPAMSILVKHFDLGMFTKEPIAAIQKLTNNPITPDYETSLTAPFTEVQHEVQIGSAELVLAKAGSRPVKISWRTFVLYGWMATTLILLGRLF